MSGCDPVIVAIGEIGIARIPVGAIGAMPAKQKAAPVRKPVARTIAARIRRIASIHPAIKPIGVFAAHGAARQTLGVIGMFAQAATSRAMSTPDVISHHVQSS